MGGNPGAIEAQEVQGQKELCNDAALPVEGSETVAHLVELGAVRENDPLFRDVTLPEGWEIKPTGHSMWSSLQNEKGEEVAAIFYKAAFYDRGAFIRVTEEFGAA